MLSFILQEPPGSGSPGERSPPPASTAEDRSVTPICTKERIQEGGILLLDLSIRKVVISAHALLTVVRHSYRFGMGRSCPGTYGLLTGRRKGEVIMITRATPMGHEEGGHHFSFKITQDLLSLSSRKKGENTVGWYRSSSVRGFEFGPDARKTHQELLELAPGSVFMTMDPSRLGPGGNTREYLRIFTLQEGVTTDQNRAEAPQFEIKDLQIRTRFDDALRTVLEMVRLERSDLPIILETEEKEDAAATRKMPAKECGESGKPGSDLEAVDQFSTTVLKLKTTLAKLKKRTSAENGITKHEFTRRAKSLKMHQLSLLDRINTRINTTTDLQMKMAFYKIRDSLSRDMRLLDDLINEQYFQVLSDIITLESDKSTTDGEGDH